MKKSLKRSCLFAFLSFFMVIVMLLSFGYVKGNKAYADSEEDSLSQGIYFTPGANFNLSNINIMSFMFNIKEFFFDRFVSLDFELVGSSERAYIVNHTTYTEEDFTYNEDSHIYSCRVVIYTEFNLKLKVKATYKCLSIPWLDPWLNVEEPQEETYETTSDERSLISLFSRMHELGVLDSYSISSDNRSIIDELIAKYNAGTIVEIDYSELVDTEEESPSGEPSTPEEQSEEEQDGESSETEQSENETKDKRNLYRLLICCACAVVTIVTYGVVIFIMRQRS